MDIFYRRKITILLVKILPTNSPTQYIRRNTIRR
jgi:hypothetical protein